MNSQAALERQTAACHEVGHAVVANALGYPVRQVQLVPPNGVAFWTGYGTLPPTIPDEDMLVIAVAGHVADKTFAQVFSDAQFEVTLECLPTANPEALAASTGLADQIDPDAGPLDQATVLRIVGRLTEQEARTRIDEAASSAGELLQDNSACLEDLTERLLRYQELDQSDDRAERRVNPSAPKLIREP